MNKFLLSAGLVGSLAVAAVPALVVAQQVTSSGAAVVVLSSRWDVDSQKVGNQWYYQTSATGRLKNNTRSTITTVMLFYQDTNPLTNQVYAKGLFVANVNPVAPGEAISFNKLISTDSPDGALQITHIQWMNQDGSAGVYDPKWQADNYFCDGSALCFNLYGR